MPRGPGGTDRPPLFQAREPPRRFVGPMLLVTALHLAVIAWIVRMPPTTVVPPRPVVPVALRPPPRKVAVDTPAGGGPKRAPPPARRRPVRRHVVPPKEIPPPVAEQQPPPPPLPDPEPLAEAEEAGDDEGDVDADGAPGGRGGGGTGTGTGTGTGVGPGTGSVGSRARKAWLARTDWRCRRPGHEELGRVVVRIRVEVLLDGSPGQVTIVRGGPEEFNRRAIDCAKDETYLPALDPEGRPTPGSAEFSIEFLN